ncbi:MAG: hypothetical protein QHH02_01010 [Syntrophomonadaceae bacterium]|nr:hypothetical protein [Syntrophomonadaceae bacterium]
MSDKKNEGKKTGGFWGSLFKAGGSGGCCSIKIVPVEAEKQKEPPGKKQ